ncbi:MAG: phage portal protein [Sphingomonadales bacterium]|nr:phage portal protein [Sphingomonadaceae bacterium]MBS3929598.1 phage portal protein [Sphingomonadales bacterium]
MKARQILTAPARGAKALGQMVFRRGNAWNLFRLPGSRFDYQSAVGDGTNSSTVVAPLEWIGRNFPAAVPTLWKVEGDEEEKQPDHPMLRLLARPNPYYSGATNWAAVIADWFVDGNGYMIVIRDRGGTPRELWWTPANVMEPKGTATEFITHYEYKPNGIAIRLEPDEVIHFRNGVDPENPRKGRSPLKSVLREVFTDDEAANFTAQLLKNMGVPGLVISPDGDYTLTDEEAAAAKEHVQANFTGDKRGEPLVTSGKTRVQPFGFSPKELDLKDLRRIPEERVTAVLGVPAIVAGLGAGLDRSTFANFSEAREAAYEECIIPTQGLIAEEIRFQLLPMFEDDPYLWRFAFDTSGIRVLQEDKDKLSERMGREVKDGVRTVAEARRALGLDAEESDEVYLRPYSAIEVPQGERAVDAPAAAPPKLKANPHLPAKFKNRIAIDALMDELDRDADALTGLLTAKLEKAFDRLGDMAAEAFEATVTEADLPKALKATGPSIADDVLDQLKTNDWFESEVKKPVRAHYEETATKTVDTINRVMDLGVMIPDPAAQEIIARGGTKLGMEDIEDETRERIVGAIEQGREEGQGAKEIARRIREDVPAGRFVNAGPKYRAELIARAETKYAQNASTVQAYKDAPNVTALLCFDARIGDEHDPECEERAGKEFTFEDADGEDLTHPNCSLSWAPVVAESL